MAASSDDFDKIRQFLAGIETYPIAGCVRIGHAPVSPALNPHQVHAGLNRAFGLVVFCVRLVVVFHWQQKFGSTIIKHCSGYRVISGAGEFNTPPRERHVLNMTVL